MYINVELWHDSFVGVVLTCQSGTAFEQLGKNMYPRSLPSVAVIHLHLLFSLARRVQCLSLKRQKNLQYNYRLFTLLCQQAWIISGLMVWLSEVCTEQSCSCRIWFICMFSVGLRGLDVYPDTLDCEHFARQDAQLSCGEGDKVYILLHHWKTVRKHF